MGDMRWRRRLRKFDGDCWGGADGEPEAPLCWDWVPEEWRLCVINVSRAFFNVFGCLLNSSRNSDGRISANHDFPVKNGQKQVETIQNWPNQFFVAFSFAFLNQTTNLAKIPKFVSLPQTNTDVYHVHTRLQSTLIMLHLSTSRQTFQSRHGATVGENLSV